MWGCAPLRSASDVYSLMASDQLVPKKLLGTFLCTSSSKLVAPLLVSRHSSSLRVGLKNDADWRRRIRHMRCGCHKPINMSLTTLLDQLYKPQKFIFCVISSVLNLISFRLKHRDKFYMPTHITLHRSLAHNSRQCSDCSCSNLK
jgi:hypothetical protein